MSAVAFAFLVALGGSFVWWIAQPLVRPKDSEPETDEEV